MDAAVLAYNLSEFLYEKQKKVLVKSTFGNRVWQILGDSSVGAYLYIKECNAKMPMWGITEKFLKMFEESKNYYIILTFHNRLFLIDKNNIERVMKNAGYSAKQGEYKIKASDVMGSLTCETTFEHICNELLK